MATMKMITKLLVCEQDQCLCLIAIKKSELHLHSS